MSATDSVATTIMRLSNESNKNHEIGEFCEMGMIKKWKDWKFMGSGWYISDKVYSFIT